MALIICPECGKKISDKAECCIGCGFPLRDMLAKGIYQIQEDTRTELDKLVDEICARNENMYVAIKELRQATGLDLKSADDLVRKRYPGKSRKR